MTRETQEMTLLKFKAWRERGLLDSLDAHINEERWERLMEAIDNPAVYNLEGINELIGLTPLVRDARSLDMPEASVDFICSNNTFEHIPGDILQSILMEFKRLIKPDGVMSHFIDMSDHFAHFDSSITIYNFLRYSKRRWRLIDNTIQPQNRMRFRDYKEMYRNTGLPLTEELVRDGDPAALSRVQIHPEFEDYTSTELAISHAYIISSMSPGI